MPTFLLHTTSDDDRNPSGWDSVIVSAPSETEARDRANDNAPATTRVHSSWASRRLPEDEDGGVLWMRGAVAPTERRESRKTGRGPT